MQWTNDSGGFRAVRLPAQEDTVPALQDALEKVGFIEQETIHVDGAVPPGREGYRKPTVSDQMVLQPGKAIVPGPSMQVVLYIDEAGGMSWHLPDGLPVTPATQTRKVRAEGVLRAPKKAVFTIPARTAEAQRTLRSSGHQWRGLVTAIGRKVLKVFVIPLAAKLLADPVQKIVGAIERRHIQEVIRPVNADNYTQKVTTPFSDWSSLAGQRALLIVHGIISSSDGMLSRLPRPSMESLAQRYEGRVIAFDHLTLSKDPEENAREFLTQLKKALPSSVVEFDILCHSRGGIVSRILAERGRSLVPNHNCDFKKVFFVATPNQGSPLGDPEHIVDMVDVFTNLVTKLPDNLASYVIEAVLGIVKLLAYTAEKALPGLAAMGTQTYIKSLNSSLDKSAALYGAAAGNYDPNPNSPRAFFAAALNSVVDRVFTLNNKALGNDLVVPCDGVYARNGHPSFPIVNPLVYSTSDYVYHTSFFEQPRTGEHINAFLQASGGAPTRSYEASYPSSRMALEEAEIKRAGAKGGAEPAGEGTSRAVRSGGGLRGRFPRIAQPPFMKPYAPPISVRRERPLSARSRKVPREAAQPEPILKQTPETILPATEVKREPEIIFHERVTEAEPNELVVTLKDLTQQARDVEKQIGIAFAAGEQAVTVHVILSASGFDVKPAEAAMIVKRERDPKSELVKFMLTAHSPGKAPIRRLIHADFFLNNRVIGSVSHATVVVPKNYSGPGADGKSWSDGFSLPAAPREECEWVLVVVESAKEAEGPTYQMLLNSTIPGATFVAKDVGKLKMQRSDMAKYLNDILGAEFDLYPNDRVMTPVQFRKEVASWQKNFMTTVQQLGKRLWQWLPQAFRDEYFQSQRAGSLPRSILIHSDEMIFPWDLLIPNPVPKGKSKQVKALGLAHVLGRWKPGLTMKPPLQTLKVRRFRVLNPKYPPADALPWAEEEVKELKKLFPKLVSAVTPSNLKSVRALFKESDVQVLHFSGHGEIDPNPDLNKILLDDNVAFTALNLADTKLCTQGQPVVYMNACSVGNVGVVVGRAGGFASNFVENGCTGVIAPFWPINDRRSMDFAIALYGKLKLGRAVGEALQELRDENADDPTYYAYAYFGDPWVRLTLQ